MSSLPVFRPLSLEDAMRAANEEHRLLLVVFTGASCQACKQMDQTTWSAPAVVQWITEHAIAIQLDAETGSEATEASVMSLPTVIALQNGTEVDRVSGARPPAQLLEWLDGLARGRTELDRLRAAPRTDLRTRLRLARALVERGLDDEATAEFAWLWEHSLEVERAWLGVRSSYLIAALEPLVARSERARKTFEAFRESAARSLGDSEALGDWVTLSLLLGQADQVVRWLVSAPAATALRAAWGNPSVWRLLEERGEWAFLGRLIEDPVALLRADHEKYLQALTAAPPGIPEEVIRTGREHLRKRFRKQAASVCRALAAAGKNDEAAQTEKAAREMDPSAEMDSALRAVSAGER
jgi:hypothetical protein